MTSRVLKTVVFMGSSRDITAPWGGPSRLGDGLLRWVQSELAKRSAQLGDETITHEVTVFDPLEVFAPGGALAESGAEMKTPHFFFKKGEAPAGMEAMAQAVKAADCYLIVTAEYNHSLPPALSSMMGHFGGSNYAFKPSGILTYSPSPYGGARAAVALRPFLSELGCLPVSKLGCFSMVGDIFNGDGTVKDAENRQLKQLGAVMDQLEWMAVALLKQKEVCAPP
jgi:NAD(P)H-dependent FMN reductase